MLMDLHVCTFSMQVIVTGSFDQPGTTQQSAVQTNVDILPTDLDSLYSKVDGLHTDMT